MSGLSAATEARICLGHIRAFALGPNQNQPAVGLVYVGRARRRVTSDAWRRHWFNFYNFSLWRGPAVGERPSAQQFIETHFGFSPDNGDGSLEIWLVVALAIFVAGL